MPIGWFLSLADAQRKIEAWRQYYNEACPVLRKNSISGIRTEY
jgi:hypothetical protein